MNFLDKPIFFIATSNPIQSRHFYEKALDFKCLSEDDFALVFELGSTTLRIQKVDAVSKVHHTVLGWEVVDIKKCIDELLKNDVQFEKFPHLTQDDLGIWCSSSSGASIAWFRDPDGNTLSLTQL